MQKNALKWLIPAGALIVVAVIVLFGRRQTPVDMPTDTAGALQVFVSPEFGNDPRNIEPGFENPIFSFAISSTANSDVTINSLTFEKSGAVPDDDFSSFRIVNYASQQMGAGGTFINNRVTIPTTITLKSGSYQTFVLRAKVESAAASFDGAHTTFSFVAAQTNTRIQGLPFLGPILTVKVTPPDTSPAAHIDTISPTSGPIGTVIELHGSHFTGFESDITVQFTNSSGKGVTIYGVPPYSTDQLIRFTLAGAYCSIDTSYSGLPCPSTIQITPGVYQIYARGYNKPSNTVQFTVTAN